MALPYPDDFALSEQLEKYGFWELFITFVAVIRAVEPISAAKKMIKKDNIESKVLIGKVGALLLQRRKRSFRRAGGRGVVVTWCKYG